MNALVYLACALVFAAPAWLVSKRYRPRFAGGERVVMQWGLDGKPNAFAPRRVALALTPAVGTVVQLTGAAMSSLHTPASERLAAIGAMAFLGAALAAIHALHLHFAARSQ